MTNGTPIEQLQQLNPPARQRIIPVASALLIGVLTAGVIYYGIESRVSAESRLAASTEQAAVPTASVIHPLNAARAQDLVLPGTTQAFIDSPVYARTNGYLKRWYYDIGARVKAGDLLAEIETQASRVRFDSRSVCACGTAGRDCGVDVGRISRTRIPWNRGPALKFD